MLGPKLSRVFNSCLYLQATGGIFQVIPPRKTEEIQYKENQKNGMEWRNAIIFQYMRYNR